MLKTLLVANRGEIAIRILRAAAELGLAPSPSTPTDDAASLHTRKADEARRSRAAGRPPTSTSTGAAASPPRRAATPSTPATASSARTPLRRAAAPSRAHVRRAPPEVLELFGDKAAARALADQLGVPVLRGTPGAIDVDEAAAFLTSLGRRRR